MTDNHLNPDQISAWFADDRPARVAEHLAVCSECQRQVAQFASVIATFRGGIRAAAETSSVPAFRAPRRAWSPGFNWALAGALAVVLVVMPLYRSHNQPDETQLPSPLAAAEVSDAALFEQVNAQLSRRVPNAMEPLAELAWTANGLDAGGSQPGSQSKGTLQ